MAKKDIIEIEGITINIGDTSVKVTPQQARQLFDALGSLLGEPKQTYWNPYWYGNVTTNITDNSGLFAGTTYTNVPTSGGSMRVIDVQ